MYNTHACVSTYVFMHTHEMNIHPPSLESPTSFTGFADGCKQMECMAKTYIHMYANELRRKSLCDVMIKHGNICLGKPYP